MWEVKWSSVAGCLDYIGFRNIKTLYLLGLETSSYYREMFCPEARGFADTSGTTKRTTHYLQVIVQIHRWDRLEF
jgi:hypothetical protein